MFCSTHYNWGYLEENNFPTILSNNAIQFHNVSIRHARIFLKYFVSMGAYLAKFFLNLRYLNLINRWPTNLCSSWMLCISGACLDQGADMLSSHTFTTLWKHTWHIISVIYQWPCDDHSIHRNPLSHTYNICNMKTIHKNTVTSIIYLSRVVTAEIPPYGW